MHSVHPPKFNEDGLKIVAKFNLYLSPNVIIVNADMLWTFRNIDADEARSSSKFKIIIQKGNHSEWFKKEILNELRLIQMKIGKSSILYLIYTFYI